MLPIDHVTVAGAALQPMRAALSAIGIDTVYGGAHRDGRTEMALVSFPDGSYLELIAPQSSAEPHLAERHPWAGFLTGNAGPCAWAICTSHIESESERLRAAGVAVSGPISSGRERPDGVRLEWQVATCGTGAAGSFFPFLIQDVTPRNLRAFPQGAPGNSDFRGIARVVLAVRHLDRAVASFHQAWGITGAIEQSHADFGAQLALPDGAPIVLAQPLHADSWLALRMEQFGEAPCAILLDAAGSPRRAADAQARWFGLPIHWFESQPLDWRLGYCY